MIDAPQIVQTEAQSTAMIHLTIPRAEIQNQMGPAIEEVLAALSAQGVTPAGPLYAHHLRMDPDGFDFQVGFPVAEDVTPAGRVRPGQLPARRVARTVYHGDYAGLAGAWGEFDSWINNAGLLPAEDLWEVYLTGPEADPDPDRWATELNRPLLE